MSQIKFKEQATPATPEAGTVVLYAKADGLLYLKGDDGVEKSVRPVGGGTGDLLSDGSVAMTADWDMGGYRIRSHQFHADASSGTAPLLVASSTLVNNLNADLLDGYQAAAFVPYTETDLSGTDWMLDEDDLVSDDDTKVPSQQSVKAYIDALPTGGDLLADGTVPLTANWDVGSYKITAETFESDVATGTAPFTVASTTVVANLNADQLDGNEASAFATSAQGALADTSVQETDYTAKGDILIASAASTPTVLAAGTDGHVLTLDSAEATGVKWAASSGGGVGKKDLWIPISDLRNDYGASNAASGNIGTLGYERSADVLLFDASSEEYAGISFPLPKSWDGGNLTYTVYWAPKSTNTGDVVWNLLIDGIGQGDLLTGAHTIGNQSVTDTANGTVDDLHISAESAAIDMSTSTGNFITLTIRRQAGAGGDTFTADAALIGFMLHYSTSASTDD